MEEKKFQGYHFENLEVWKIGMQLISEVYQLTKKFPREELFALVDQFKRAAVSVVLNITEGSGQPTSKGFALYLRRSRASVLECIACSKIALQQKFLAENELAVLNELLKEEYFKLNALEKSVRKRNA